MVRSKKKKNLNDGTPFADLAKDIEKTPEPVDLQSKVRTFQAKRNTKREPIFGSADLCDLRKKVISKAEFRNLSADGVSLEILPIRVMPNDDVYVHFASAVNIGLVLCTIQWVINIEGHKLNHKLIGLKFKNLTSIKQKKLEEFLSKVEQGRHHDPFYGD